MNTIKMIVNPVRRWTYYSDSGLISINKESKRLIVVEQERDLCIGAISKKGGMATKVTKPREFGNIVSSIDALGVKYIEATKRAIENGKPFEVNKKQEKFTTECLFKTMNLRFVVPESVLSLAEIEMKGNTPAPIGVATSQVSLRETFSIALVSLNPVTNEQKSVVTASRPYEENVVVKTLGSDVTTIDFSQDKYIPYFFYNLALHACINSSVDFLINLIENWLKTSTEKCDELEEELPNLPDIGEMDFDKM